MGGMDCAEVAEDIRRWRALVNAVMNLWLPSNDGEFLDKLKTG